VRLSLPAFVVLILFPTELLHLFGEGFAAGAAVTALLALGQLFDVATGPCGHMLLMSGRPALTMTSNLAGLAVNVVLNLWLIPRYGIVGAGVAWACSLALINLMRVTFVWATMRMLPLDRGLAKALPATAAAVGVALLVRASTDGSLTLALGVGGIALAYVGVVLLLGLGPEDRFLLATLRQRVSWRNA
jgi:O-antigen/teichoic acid export membrane protein